jgi:hypothetical protein
MDVAARLVDLVRDNAGKLRDSGSFSESEVRVLMDVVEAAGFDQVQLSPGKLRGNYLDQDGRRTGETYPINILCPFQVMNPSGHVHWVATGWLDCALQRVAHTFGDREKAIEDISHEILRSVPLEPIKLTHEGDLLEEYPVDTTNGYFVDHRRDGDTLISCVGIHKHCMGFMDRRTTSATHDVILCRACGLRVTFPREVKTFGELRQALAKRLATQIS